MVNKKKRAEMVKFDQLDALQDQEHERCLARRMAEINAKKGALAQKLVNQMRKHETTKGK